MSDLTKQIFIFADSGNIGNREFAETGYGNAEDPCGHV